SSNPKKMEATAQKLVDHIAKSLPEDVRAEFYRVMMRCNDLPENDEMLCILNVIKMLTLLIVQVPDRIVTEREKLEKLFADVIESLTHVIRSNKEYQTGLDERIRELPKTILNGLNPADFGIKINEHLKQQLTALELPQASRALSTLASDVKRTTGDFKSAADGLKREYSGATASAVEAIGQMKSAVSSAVEKVLANSTELAGTVETWRWGTTAIIAGLTLVLGLVLGLLFGGNGRPHSGF
ncbi:MAG TPA: hypothetical protein VGV87_21930, partial [Blastocatellia bacterium]|nr:hypothetical protein [Blastocatellia bacterium]